MRDTDHVISIKILDRNYNIKCPKEQAYELQQSADYVEEHMRRLRQNGNISSIENLLAVAALNISHELVILKKQQNQYIDSMQERI
jgi:cell division protein ZapA